jgi:hypothetical protein
VLRPIPQRLGRSGIMMSSRLRVFRTLRPERVGAAGR